MTKSENLDGFRAAATGNPIDVHSLGKDRERVLWALGVLKTAGINDSHKVSDIVTCLRDVSGIEISRQHVQQILEKEFKKKTVSRKVVAGTGHYKIMRTGEESIKGAIVAARFVDPVNALDEIRNLESVVSTFKGKLRVCDPYIDNRTLDFLAECKAATAIHLLTVQVQDGAKVRRDLAAFRAQHGASIDIKVLSAGGLHDRYIVHDDGILILGGSLNGFAKKQMFIISLGTDFGNGMAKVFDVNWVRASAF
jgi:hypothetical protein